MKWPLIAIIVSGLVQQAPPPPTPAGTATLKGKVVDQQTGTPVARAIVTLRSSRTRYAQQNLTDDRGQFEFGRLAAGPYDLRASPGEYRATHVSATYAPATSEKGALLELREGEERTDIVIALPRARAISGRVTDEDGNPLANVEVSLATSQGGGMASPGPPGTTDDRGMFRLYGLASGRYRLCAVARRGPTFDSQPRQRRPQYVPTCYPSVTDASESTDISLSDQDVSGIEIRVQRRPTYRLSGQVVGADGVPPENASLMVTQIERNHSTGSGTQLASGGSFTVSNVVPGLYEVSAQLGRDVYSGRPDERDPQWGAIRLEVTSADVEGLVVQMKTAATLKGTLTFEDPPLKPGTGPLQVTAQPLPYGGGNRRSAPPANVAENGDFALQGLFGPLVLRVYGGLPPGYVVKSMLYRGKDIADTAVEFDGNAAHTVDVLLTNRTAELSGQVVDNSGAPVPGVLILHFPVDASRWKAFEGARSTTSVQGRYRLPRLVAGDYFVAAVSAADQRTLDLPDDYARLAAVAERVTVLESERRTADLRVTPVPPRGKQP